MASPLLTTVAALALFIQGLAVSAFSDRVHETRETASGGHNAWRPAAKLPAEAIIPVRIALKQQNLDTGVERLMSISHPESPDYGKTLTADEVTDLFAPSEASVQTVRDWLLESGVPPATIAHSDSKGWLAVDMTAAHAESLFKSELYEFEHSETGEDRARLSRSNTLLT